MAVNLGKGAKVSLAKAATDAGITTPLAKVAIGLAWDPQVATGQDFDLDASVLMVDANNKCRDDRFVYYGLASAAGQPFTSKDGSVQHSGDNRKGDAAGDDEVITVDLNAVPAEVDKLVIIVTIHDAVARKQNFGQVNNAKATLYDVTNGAPVELLKYELNEDMSNDTAVHVCSLYRKGGEWKFDAAGAGQVEGLDAICRVFGLDVA